MAFYLFLVLLFVIVALALTLWRVDERLQSLERLFHKFVPTEYLALIQENHLSFLEGKSTVEREVTVLFLDIRNFVALSHQHSQNETLDYLQRLYRNLSPRIREHKGFIDKYMGDGLMAIFPRHPDDAVKAAFSLLSKMKWVHFGIGIHRGIVQISCLGDSKRSALTAISQTVNLAARLEQMSKNLRSPLIISDETYQALSPFLRKRFSFQGSHPIKGLPTPLPLYISGQFLERAA